MSKLTRVALINPPQLNSLDDRIDPPLGLMYIAGVLEQNGVDVSITDLAGTKKEDWYDLIPRADIYGITVFSASLNTSRAIANIIKQKNRYLTTIIAGGPHPTSLPVETLANSEFDHIIRGEGEYAFLDFIRNEEKGIENPKIIQAPVIKDINALPLPARHLIDMQSYSREVEGKKATSIITSRGCGFVCNFCCKDIHGSKVRFRSPEKVLEEIAGIQSNDNIHSFIFYDDIFTLNRKRLATICDGLKKMNLTFRCNGHAGTNTYEDYVMLKEAGCQEIAFGIECLAPDTNIQLSNGNIIEIKNHNNEKILSADFNSVKLKPADCVKLKKLNKKKDMLEIKTVFPTRKITVTPTHKFFIYGENGIEEVEAKNLKKKNYVAIIKGFNTGKHKYGIELSEILGYFTGDGYADFRTWTSKKTGYTHPKYRIRFSDKNKKLLVYYKYQIGKIFGCKPRIDKIKDKNSYVLTVNSKRFLMLLQSLGLMVGSRKRQIPKEILQSTNEEIAAYLRGLYDAEGNICKDGNIVFTSSSKKLMEQVKFSLSRLDIESYSKKTIWEKFGGKYIGYILNCKHLKDFNKIGFNHPEKEKRFKSIFKKMKINNQNYLKSEALNIPPQLIKKILRENGHGTTSFYKKMKISLSPYIYGDDIPSKGMIKRIVSCLKYKSPISKSILKFANSKDIHWAKIDSIKNKKCNVVYDLHVPKYSNYIANGFIVHNSGSQYILDRINKRTTVKQNADTIQTAKRAGLLTKAYLVVGFPGETQETIDATKRFMDEANPDKFTLFQFVPLPGCDVYKHPEKYGVTEMNKDWDQFFNIAGQYEGGSSFRTSELSPERIKYLHDDLLKHLMERGQRGKLQSYYNRLEKK